MEGGRGGFRRVGRDLDLHLGYLNMGLSEAGGDNECTIFVPLIRGLKGSLLCSNLIRKAFLLSVLA